jgi:hypothetical protein
LNDSEKKLLLGWAGWHTDRAVIYASKSRETKHLKFDPRLASHAAELTASYFRSEEWN